MSTSKRPIPSPKPPAKDMVPFSELEEYHGSDVKPTPEADRETSPLTAEEIASAEKAMQIRRIKVVVAIGVLALFAIWLLVTSRGSDTATKTDSQPQTTNTSSVVTNITVTNIVVTNITTSVQTSTNTVSGNSKPTVHYNTRFEITVLPKQWSPVIEVPDKTCIVFDCDDRSRRFVVMANGDQNLKQVLDRDNTFHLTNKLESIQIKLAEGEKNVPAIIWYMYSPYSTNIQPTTQ